MPTPSASQPLHDAVIAAMRTVFDPEVPVNIYDLGLIYDLQIDPAGVVTVKMTLTTPACPVAGILPGQVEARVKEVDGVQDAKVELVWDPPWTPQRMSDAAKLQLNMDLDPGAAKRPGQGRYYAVRGPHDR